MVLGASSFQGFSFSQFLTGTLPKVPRAEVMEANSYRQQGRFVRSLFSHTCSHSLVSLLQDPKP